MVGLIFMMDQDQAPSREEQGLNKAHSSTSPQPTSSCKSGKDGALGPTSALIVEIGDKFLGNFSAIEATLLETSPLHSEGSTWQTEHSDGEFHQPS